MISRILGRSRLTAGSIVGLLLVLAPAAGLSARAAQPTPKPARLSLFQRLAPDKLEQFDRDRAAVAKNLKPIEVPYPFVRSALHNHSHLSHDSDGQIEEIIAAAKATNTKIVGFTEHPRRDIDVVAENVKGLHGGVYFLAGTESSNALTWPAREGQPTLRFVSHPEGVETFDPKEYDGIEIYNTHSDLIEEQSSGNAMTAIILRLPAFKAHPEAGFAALLDYPADFLATFDRVTCKTPFSGIAANDAHQNNGLKIVAHPDGTVQAVRTPDDVVWENKGIPAAMLMAGFGQKGKPEKIVTLTEMQLDSYEIAFRQVGTYLQIEQINEKTIRHALRTGRIILGFEIVAPLPAVGFWVERNGKPIGTVGDQIALQDGLTLRCLLPHAADIRLIRNGKPIREISSNALTVTDLTAGVYRLEAFLNLAGRQWPWVLTNPIYIRQSN